VLYNLKIKLEAAGSEMSVGISETSWIFFPEDGDLNKNQYFVPDL
jgi:hypothetical protein